MTPRLKELYYKEIQPALKEQLGFKNTFQGPKLVKVVINMGLGLDAVSYTHLTLPTTPYV